MELHFPSNNRSDIMLHGVVTQNAFPDHSVLDFNVTYVACILHVLHQEILAWYRDTHKHARARAIDMHASSLHTNKL
jgi:hypothetical protein